MQITADSLSPEVTYRLLSGVVVPRPIAWITTLNAEGVTTPFRLHAIPQRFLDHAKRGRILEQIGLTPQAIALRIVEDITALSDGPRGPSAGAPVEAERRV